MGDNRSAFQSDEYDKKIKQTLPYYEDFYRQITELVKACHFKTLNWLDVGCGTGKMAACTLSDFAVERFVFLDSSEEMLAIAKRRFGQNFCEFRVGDVCNLPYRAEFEVITAVQVNHYLQAKVLLDKEEVIIKENEAFLVEGRIPHSVWNNAESETVMIGISVE